MSDEGLSELAKEYRKSAQKLKNWLKENDTAESIVDKRIRNQMIELLKETVSVARYLETYYKGNRMDCSLYNSIYGTGVNEFNDD